MNKPPRGRHRRRATGPKFQSRRETVVIGKLAAQADGEGRLADGNRAFVPFTLPGDRVDVETTGKRSDGILCRVVDFETKAPRAEPICAVFGRCGGCQLQHAPEDVYVAWKRGLVEEHLRRHGIDVPLAPLARVPVASRRRVGFAAILTMNGVEFGFHEAESGRIVAIGTCPILVPEIDRLMAPLREMTANLLSKTGERVSLDVTSLPGGILDLVIERDAVPDLAAREALAEFSEMHGVARVAWRMGEEAPEPIALRRDVTASFGGVPVALPIGGFLQPSLEGEATLQRLVREGVKGATKIADLYCGIGTFALDLVAAGASVHAVDGAEAQVKALSLAAGRAGLGGKVTTEIRDLRARPLDAASISKFDAVVFDPPRAGAKSQADEIALSGIGKCVAVSCNPATLARDLRVLVDAGFTVDGVTPVDQFPHSRHVEAVAVLSR